MNNRAIGIFDSGIGGLTVLKSMVETLPNEDFVYFGDTARVPYGTKSKKVVTAFSIENAMFLLKHQVKAIVVACNTASSLALGDLKKIFYTIPIIDMVGPVVQTALEKTCSGRIGVIGTNATIKSGIYEKTLRKKDPGVKVYSSKCGLFVPLVEEGWADENVAYEIARTYLKNIKAKNIDTLILGCTHYPMLKNIIGRVLGSKVRLIDCGGPASKKLYSILEMDNQLTAKKTKGRVRYFVSDSPQQFAKLGSKFLGKALGSVKMIGK